jgi:hypothetical protein
MPAEAAAKVYCDPLGPTAVEIGAKIFTVKGLSGTTVSKNTNEITWVPHGRGPFESQKRASPASALTNPGQSRVT